MPLGPERIRNGGFEVAGGGVQFLPSGDPGTMPLAGGTANHPAGWNVNTGPIHWLSDQTARFYPSPPRPFQGHYFLDLTGNGANRSGGVYQRIRGRMGRTYRVSLALGMDDSRGDAGGPVEVTVTFIAYLSSQAIGQVRFRRDRYDSGGATWAVQSADTTLNVDLAEVVDEQIVAFLERQRNLASDATDPHRTVVLITAVNLTTERTEGQYHLAPSNYVGLDAVSVRQVANTLPELIEIGIDYALSVFGGR